MKTPDPRGTLRDRLHLAGHVLRGRPLVYNIRTSETIAATPNRGTGPVIVFGNHFTAAAGPARYTAEEWANIEHMRHQFDEAPAPVEPNEFRIRWADGSPGSGVYASADAAREVGGPSASIEGRRRAGEAATAWFEVTL